MQATHADGLDMLTATIDLPQQGQGLRALLGNDSAAAMLANQLPGRNTVGEKVRALADRKEKKKKKKKGEAGCCVHRQHVLSFASCNTATRNHV